MKWNLIKNTIFDLKVNETYHLLLKNAIKSDN